MNQEAALRMMERSPLFDGIRPEDLRAFWEEVHPIVEAYDKNEIIIQADEVEKDLGLVLSGGLRGELFHLEGDLHLVDVYEPGDLFNLGAVVSRTRVTPLAISASAKSEVLIINADTMLQSGIAQKLQQNIIRILADENIKKLYKVNILSRNGLRDRILTYLQIMDRKHKGRSFHTMMTQEQFAKYLSVNRSALSNELNKMRREGIIDFEKDRFRLLYDREDG